MGDGGLLVDFGGGVGDSGFGNSVTDLAAIWIFVDSAAAILAATMLARAAFLIFAPKNPHDFGDNFANLPITSFPSQKN